MDKKPFFQPYYNWNTQNTELSAGDDFLIDDKGKLKMRITENIVCDPETGKTSISTPLFGRFKNYKKK